MDSQQICILLILMIKNNFGVIISPLTYLSVVFKNIAALHTHNKKVHDVYSGEQFSCEICGIALKCEQSYMNHKKSQHPSGKDLEDIPCQCAKCEIKFNTSDELNQHQIGS